MNTQVVTREKLAQKLIDYLHHRLTLAQLVDWAETALMEAELEERDIELLREVLARVGVADVKTFGLSWEDCEDFLSRLGYRIRVQVSEAS